MFSLFSCVIFSSCGNKYENLKMSFYNEDSEIIDNINFVMESGKDASQRICINFENIDKDDIGEIIVYSPESLVETSNYTYTENLCFVDVKPIKVSEEGAKLYVRHYASGKTENIDLVIKQKSNNIQLLKDNIDLQKKMWHNMGNVF